jgi:acid stress chaperone HdeA
MKVKMLCMIASIALPAVAHAEPTKPLAQWTCKDYLDIEDVIRPKVVYWSSAHAKPGKPKAVTIKIKETEQVIPILEEDCRKASGESFWKHLEAAWKKVESDAKTLKKKI